MFKKKILKNKLEILKTNVTTVILFIAIIVASFSLYMIIATLVGDSREKEAFEELALYVERERAKTPEIEDVIGNVNNISKSSTKVANDEYKKSEEVSPYQVLYNINNDFYGWLKIEDTPINYPVMFTPDDSQYYLRRAFDKTDSQSGTPFLDASSFEGCGNYIIYGHHMKNDTMFGTLLNYSQKDYWEEHKIISFDTLDENAEYEIIAAFYSEANADSDNDFKYYRYTDLTEPNVFEEFIDKVKEAAIYDTGLTAEYKDELLTLSTCSYHTDNGRFAVVAKKINSELFNTVLSSYDEIN